MLGIERLERITDRLDTATGSLSDPASDLGRLTTRAGEPSSTLTDVLALLFAELAEA
jgi:hypothetical protein